MIIKTNPNANSEIFIVNPQSQLDFAPMPYFHRPLLNYFSNQSSGYNAGTIDYYNAFFTFCIRSSSMT